MEGRLTVTVLACMFLLAGTPSDACSMASCLNRGVELRRDFAVMITDDGKPLAGVTVEVTSQGAERFSGITLTDGTVNVIGLPPGDYWLNAELLGISAAYQCFHINDQASRNAKPELIFEWGNDAYATRRVVGRLIDSQAGKGGTPLWNLVHRTDVAIIGATLKLQDPITGATYSAISDDNGDFAFDTVPNGTYVLHISGAEAGAARKYDSTDLLIELTPTATHDKLLFARRDAGGGSCGGAYLDLQNKN